MWVIAIAASSIVTCVFTGFILKLWGHCPHNWKPCCPRTYINKRVRLHFSLPRTLQGDRWEIESRNRLGGNALEFKKSAKKVTPFIVAKWDLNVAFWRAVDKIWRVLSTEEITLWLAVPGSYCAIVTGATTIPLEPIVNISSALWIVSQKSPCSYPRSSSSRNACEAGELREEKRWN